MQPSRHELCCSYGCHSCCFCQYRCHYYCKGPAAVTAIDLAILLNFIKYLPPLSTRQVIFICVKFPHTTLKKKPQTFVRTDTNINLFTQGKKGGGGISLCSLDCPLVCNPPASALRVLGLQVCVRSHNSQSSVASYHLFSSNVFKYPGLKSHSTQSENSAIACVPEHECVRVQRGQKSTYGAIPQMPSTLSFVCLFIGTGLLFA